MLEFYGGVSKWVILFVVVIWKYGKLGLEQLDVRILYFGTNPSGIILTVGYSSGAWICNNHGRTKGWAHETLTTILEPTQIGQEMVIFAHSQWSETPAILGGFVSPQIQTLKIPEIESFISQKTCEIGPLGHLKTALVAQQVPSAGYSLGKDTVACLALGSFGLNTNFRSTLDHLDLGFRMKKYSESLRHVSHQSFEASAKTGATRSVRVPHLPIGMLELHQNSSSWCARALNDVKWMLDVAWLTIYSMLNG